ncbi:SymE family type I addiction module toxin [Agriterribacter sp.]|uniref:SymE family type I addiction module toxin n=1 Tax=Agriterribacter sp. TaxID=2821509 RepID=UPI002BB5B6EC|nr:SymE family type I addiction module toxin [Agriterribacter sp.]HRP58258.1 SymE family type I addiction module toxin [Agriterribacter sp.]
MPNNIKTRRLTVCNKAFDREYGPYVSFPVIRLCGKWLQDSGFRAGHTIDITYQDGKIIITKSEVQRFNDI